MCIRDRRPDVPEKTEHGIYSTEIAAGLTDNGALVADAVLSLIHI